jgi:2-methylaconitate cis-trans-isomerase PrpF
MLLRSLEAILALSAFNVSKFFLYMVQELLLAKKILEFKFVNHKTYIRKYVISCENVKKNVNFQFEMRLLSMAACFWLAMAASGAAAVKTAAAKTAAAKTAAAKAAAAKTAAAPSESVWTLIKAFQHLKKLVREFVSLWTNAAVATLRCRTLERR